MINWLSELFYPDLEMSIEHEHREEINTLLPFGATLQPLIASSNLTESDLKYSLQRRGIFSKYNQRLYSVPKLASLLLSPKEFNILKNRQNNREANIKVTTSQARWVDNSRSLSDVLPADINSLVEGIVDQSSAYQITNCKPIIESNKIIIEGQIKRNDWTKEVFSNTTFHTWRISIERDEKTGVVEFRSESTTPETKQLLDRIQSNAYKRMQQSDAVSRGKNIQKIISNAFISNAYKFEYLREFLKNNEFLKFKKVVNISAGVDSTVHFPDKFSWLRGKIELISLKGSEIQETDAMSMGELGLLLLGDIDALFSFSFKDKNSDTDISGTCVIRYGFPKSTVKKKDSEFEVKILDLKLDSQCVHISKEQIKRTIIGTFQKLKHLIFEKYKASGKASVDDKQMKLF